MAETRRFEVVEGTEAPNPPEDNSAATQALVLALKALSQRALIAVDNLFTLISVCLVFWLFKSLPTPDTFQLAALGIFSLFVLAANVIVRRK